MAKHTVKSLSIRYDTLRLKHALDRFQISHMSQLGHIVWLALQISLTSMLLLRKRIDRIKQINPKILATLSIAV